MITHRCHAVGCTATVPPNLLMCRRHWYMVPKPLRDEVWHHYRPGQERHKRPSEAYLAAAKRAVDAVAAKEGQAALPLGAAPVASVR